jgi:hypothetical protein
MSLAEDSLHSRLVEDGHNLSRVPSCSERDRGAAQRGRRMHNSVAYPGVLDGASSRPSFEWCAAANA